MGDKTVQKNKWIFFISIKYLFNKKMELSRETFLAIYFFTAEEEKARDLFAFCGRKKSMHYSKEGGKSHQSETFWNSSARQET